MTERNKEIKKKLIDNLSDIKAGKVIVYAIDEVHLLEGDLISHEFPYKNKGSIGL